MRAIQVQATMRTMKRIWLLFSQSVTVVLAAWFVVATLQPGWLKGQGSAKTIAFTQALLDTDLYCEQMQGFEQYNEITGELLVCKLKKALEGGKQSGYL